MPKRIQRKRSKGWTMPKGAVYVGRGTKWGNPYKIGTCLIGNAEMAVAAYAANLPLGPFARELRGLDLACWCPLDQPCHADVLLRIANERSVADIADADLLRRAVTSARPNGRGKQPRWVGVMDAFGLGSTFANQLCRRFGLDPDEKVKR